MGGRRVLLVEDETLIRHVLAETLAGEGYDVIEAATGDQAAALIEGPDGFAAVVTDLHTPGERDGIAVGRLARERDNKTSVIYVTGRPDAMGAARLHPRDAFLRKPYLPSQVVAVLRRLLPD